MRKIIFIILLAVSLVGCGLEAAAANSVRYNLEVAEQNFEIFRRAVFYNGITGEYILTIEGRLAITVDSDGDLVVTVKTETGEYLKHYLGLSDNVTWFSEQLRSATVSDAQYRVIFKPSTLLWDVDLQ